MNRDVDGPNLGKVLPSKSANCELICCVYPVCLMTVRAYILKYEACLILKIAQMFLGSEFSNLLRIGLLIIFLILD